MQMFCIYIFSLLSSIYCSRAQMTGANGVLGMLGGD
jgi:hypothetical protein